MAANRGAGGNMGGIGVGASLIALVLLGMTILRDGHTVLFCFGFVFSLLWIVNALMAPTLPVAADARANPASRLLGACLAALGHDVNLDRALLP